MNIMAGLRRQAVVADLVRRLQEAGSWSGETHVQKSLYFLLSLGVPINYEFILYKHGPYSFDLHDDLVGMIGTGFLSVESRPPYGPSLDVTGRGQNVLRRFPKTTKQYAAELDFVADALAEENVNSLERLATALYVTHRLGRSKNVGSRVAELTRLKPHVSLPDAQRAVERVDQLIQDAETSGLQIKV